MVAAQSRVNGTLSGSQLYEITRLPNNVALVLRTDVALAIDGRVTFSANGANAAKLWVDGVQVDGEAIFTTQLQAGKRTVIV